MQRLGILLSGRGSNFLAIAKAISEQRLPGAEIAVVLSNVDLKTLPKDTFDLMMKPR